MLSDIVWFKLILQLLLNLQFSAISNSDSAMSGRSKCRKNEQICRLDNKTPTSENLNFLHRFGFSEMHGVSFYFNYGSVVVLWEAINEIGIQF